MENTCRHHAAVRILAPRLAIFHGKLIFAESCLHQILTKYLNLHLYKIQMTEELKSAVHALRRVFVNLVLQRQPEDAEFSHKIIFSDEVNLERRNF